LYKIGACAASGSDGKSTLECKGNDVMAIDGVTATVSDTAIKTSGNCQLTLTNVKITAPVGIEAGGVSKVVVTGGSINGSSNTIVAQNSASVTVSGTQLTGKTKKVGGGKIVGAP
jgi:hypothetical protein